MLLAMGVFILHAPPSVVRVPALQYPCVNEFTTCLQADNVQVRAAHDTAGRTNRACMKGTGLTNW